ncbi:MAG TPA: Ldh family oxidoreductase [Polyangiales bacterium]|nr:Ldh family oxidoreductase [Polyangiales bacterium]
MIALDATRFAAVTRDAFAAIQVAEPSIEHVVGATVEASLRGVDSHGIQLLPHYHRAARAGRVNRTPSFTVTKRSAAAALLDADSAFGHHAAVVAIELAEELASKAGVGTVAVCHSTHFGSAAYAPLMAARRGHLAFGFTNADGLVRAFGATRAMFGTNPVCITAPLDGEDPCCLDMATSTVSWNKILNHRTQQAQLGAGWAADAAGQATQDANAARMLEPVGGYKGFGLGMFVEVLCGLLAGGPIAHEILPMFTAPLTERRNLSHFFAVVDIAAFTDPASFRARLTALAQSIRALGKDVMIPGDPEKRALAHRSVHGIPMTEERFAEFVAIDPAYRHATLT